MVDSNPANRNVVAAVLGLSGMLAGTFGAHGLKGRVSETMLGTFETGVHYHLIHAVALLALGAISARSAWLNGASAALALGVVLFSGSLYAMALTDLRWLGWITPFGGVAFLVGWVLVCIWAIRARRGPNGDLWR